MADGPISFAREAHPSPLPATERGVLTANPGFGRVFTDHMAVIRYTEDAGWHDARITARVPLTVDPSTAVLHYAQEIFEGLKAYRQPDGGVALFRPEANARRFRDSARRMAMAELPEELFLASLEGLVRADRDWLPDREGATLYLRPFAIASEVFLGVKPASEYLYMVIASSVGDYFRGGAEGITLWVSDQFSRAAPGGTGAAKCGGNYASSLAAQREAIAQGCDQVIFLDAAERRWVEELGGMNIFFVFEGERRLRTPPLTGTILPGITRDSLIRLARDEGLTVEEEPYAIDQWRDDAASGRLVETFACGTAAVVTPVARVRGPALDITINGGVAGAVTRRLKDRLVALQRGLAPDPYGWRHRID